MNEEKIDFPTTQEEIEKYQKEYTWKADEKQWYKPISADELGSGQGEIPNIEDLPYTGQTLDITTATSLQELLKFRQEQYKEERGSLEESFKGADVETEGKSKWDWLTSLWGKRPEAKLEEKMGLLEEKYGVTEWQDKVEEQNIKVAKISGDIDKMEAMRTEEIADSRERLRAYPGAIKEGEARGINREYDKKRAYKVAELNAEAALMSAYSGNLTNADKLKQEALSAYTFDIQMKINDFDTLFKIRGDWIDSLDKEDQNILKEKRENLLIEKQTKDNENSQKLDWIIRASERGVDLGINLANLNDISLEEVASAYQSRVSAVAGDKEYAPSAIKREWEEAGGEAGTKMNLFDYISWRTGTDKSTIPRDWTDEELRTEIMADKADNTSYEDVLNMIEQIPIKNKDRARLIASEIFKKEPKKGILGLFEKQKPVPGYEEIKKVQAEAVRGFFENIGEWGDWFGGRLTK